MQLLERSDSISHENFITTDGDISIIDLNVGIVQRFFARVVMKEIEKIKQEVRQQGEVKILIFLALIVTVVYSTGCSTGGYLQIGYIPVNEVDDRHMNKKNNEHYWAKKENQ